MNKIIDLYVNDYGDALARSLNIKTGFPIYTIYDIDEPIYNWGRNYFHFFVKIDDTYYLNGKGLSTAEELKVYWANAFNDLGSSEMVPENLRIIKKSPPSPYTGDIAIDEQLNKMGCGIDIPEHVKVYADILINTFELDDI